MWQVWTTFWCIELISLYESSGTMLGIVQLYLLITVQNTMRHLGLLVVMHFINFTFSFQIAVEFICYALIK